MSTQWRSVACLVGFVFIFCLGTVAEAGAQTRPASAPIVDKRTQRLLESIPGSATDLPPFLVKPSDAYLLITAGASYTQIQLLENPEAQPQTVATALSLALAGTSLQGQTVEWSADRYSAAQVIVRHPRFGAVRGTNVVPIAALLASLRRSGLTPHLLLRVAAHARLSHVLPSHYGNRTFRWYDARRLGNPSGVTITARITWLSFARILAYYLVSPLVCLLGLGLAGLIGRSRQQREPTGNPVSRRLSSYVVTLAQPFFLFTPGRSVFRLISSSAIFGALIVQTVGMVFLLQTPTPAALADLWFGNSTTAFLVPFLILGIAPVAPFLLLARKQEIRLFGPVPIGPAIPMSDEEKAVRKRVAQYTMLPHLIGAVLLGASPFLVARTSPLYPILHPLELLLPALGGGLVAWMFRKQVDKFTQKTLDDDLTWRARQLGQKLGVRMPDVFVEDSSRAAHLAFATHQGHHITLSRKLQETFTEAETEFVLAFHLAGMKRQVTPSNVRIVGLLLSLLLLIGPIFFFSLTSPSGTVVFSQFILSAWFVLALGLYTVLLGGLLLMLFHGSTTQEIGRDQAIDRNALEATGNLAAADSALSKLDAGAEMAVLRSSNALTSELGHKAEMLQTARLLLRRAALQKAAQELSLVPAPATILNDNTRTR